MFDMSSLRTFIYQSKAITDRCTVTLCLIILVLCLHVISFSYFYMPLYGMLNYKICTNARPYTDKFHTLRKKKINFYYKYLITTITL